MCTGSSVTVTRRFYYSAYPVLGCYSQFPLLDISRYWLLHNVSYTRRIQWKALLAFLLKHSITRHFNYSTFQRSPIFHHYKISNLSVIRSQKNPTDMQLTQDYRAVNGTPSHTYVMSFVIWDHRKANFRRACKNFEIVHNVYELQF